MRRNADKLRERNAHHWLPLLATEFRIRTELFPTKNSKNTDNQCPSAATEQSQWGKKFFFLPERADVRARSFTFPRFLRRTLRDGERNDAKTGWSCLRVRARACVSRRKKRLLLLLLLCYSFLFSSSSLILSNFVLFCFCWRGVGRWGWQKGSGGGGGE